MGRSRLTAALKPRAPRRVRRGARGGGVRVRGGRVAFWATAARARCSTTPESYVLEARDGTLLERAHRAATGSGASRRASTVPAKFRRALLVVRRQAVRRAHAASIGLAIARALRLNLERRPRGERRQHAHHAAGARCRAASEQRNLANKLAEALLALRIEASLRQGRDPGAVRGACAVRRQRRRPRGGRVALLRPRSATRCRGPRPRRSRCCRTIRRSCTWRATASGCKSKRDFLLRRLHEAGDLTALDLDLALSEPLTAEPHDLPDLAPHLLETLRAQDPARHRIVTTLDARLQARARRDRA